MNENKRILGTDLAKLDAHEITAEEYEEIPELTEEWFQKADLYHGDTLIRRGRPPKAAKKISIHLRVDPDIARAFRATGKGWQTRAQEALKQWIEKQPVK